IFAETHNELESLNNDISKLQDIYLTNDSDEDSDNETNEYKVHNEAPISLIIYNNNFFTVDQIKHFHKIYTLYPMRTVIEDEKACEKRLDKRDDNVFLTKLQQLDCCVKKYYLNINHQSALKRYQEMIAMTSNESSLCFLGIINASINALKFKNGTPKLYLTTSYKFEGIMICQKTWYIIYDIQKRRWEALHLHY
ncbi:9847_t:CDS:1, partial [Cetraspora pellucida]